MQDSYMQKIFETGLGLTEPWKIEDIAYEPDKNNPSIITLSIKINFTPGATFKIDGLDEKYKAYDTKERTWRHLNFFQYRCYITARVPRVKTPEGKIITVDVPWARSGSGFTLLLEGLILTLAKHMPIKAVAKEIGEHDTRIWRVLKHHVKKSLNGQDFKDVSAIGVDEYSHRGHNYITVFLSHPKVVKENGKRVQKSKGRVLFVTEGKDKGAVERFKDHFLKQNGETSKVDVVTSDMIHGFRNSMKKYFSKATVTVDKFHVIKNCQDAVDAVRRREMRSKDQAKINALANTRYLWLKNPENLNKQQKEQLEGLLSIDYLNTAQAYNLRLELQNFYDSHAILDEKTYFDYEQLVLKFANSPVPEMNHFSKMLTTNAIEILNYFKTLMTNAILEGFNSSISIIKNRAKGFKNMQNFINMIYFCLADLDIPFASIL